MTKYLSKGQILTLIITAFLISACNVNNSNKPKELTDVTGTLIWGGYPASDGQGILFETETKTYGAPGNRDDYNTYFPQDSNRVAIIADIIKTGEKTYRGWGVPYPGIEFLEIRAIAEN